MSTRRKPPSSAKPAFIAYPYPPEEVEQDFYDLVKRVGMAITDKYLPKSGTFDPKREVDVDPHLIYVEIYNFLEEISQNPDMAATPHGLKLLEYAWKIYLEATGGEYKGADALRASDAILLYSDPANAAIADLHNIAGLMIPPVWNWYVQACRGNYPPTPLRDAAEQEQLKSAGEAYMASKQKYEEALVSNNLAELLDELDRLTVVVPPKK